MKLGEIMGNDYSDADRLRECVEGKNVLYVATKNTDYLRIEQEIQLLKKWSDNVEVVVSPGKYYILRLLYVYWKVLFYTKSVDVVFIGFAPQLVLPLFRWKFKNRIIIIDFFISLYDTLVFDRKYFLDGGFVSKILKRVDEVTLTYADLIICDTSEHSRYFVRELGADLNKVVVLYLSADSKYYYPRHIDKPIDLKNKFIVLYFGSVLPLQGVDVVLNAIDKITENDVHFIIIGPVNDAQRAHRLGNVSYINWLAQEQLSVNIAFSDLCLAGHFNGDIEKARRVIPGKAYIYEAMNKSMILGENDANRERYPQEYSDVLFVKMGDADELARAIMLSCKSWRRLQMGKNNA